MHTSSFTFLSYIVTMLHVCSICNKEFGIRCPRLLILIVVESYTYYQADDFVESNLAVYHR